METRGILRPAGVDQLFRLERRPPLADLAGLIDDHWLVSWDLRERDDYEARA